MVIIITIIIIIILGMVGFELRTVSLYVMHIVLYVLQLVC